MKPFSRSLSLLKTSLVALASVLPRAGRGGASRSAPSPLSRALTDDEARVIDETLDSLQIPRENVPIWLAHNREFCERHGGRRHYGELMDLLDAFDHVHAQTALENRERTR